MRRVMMCIVVAMAVVGVSVVVSQEPEGKKGKPETKPKPVAADSADKPRPYAIDMHCPLWPLYWDDVEEAYIFQCDGTESCLFQETTLYPIGTLDFEWPYSFCSSESCFPATFANNRKVFKGIVKGYPPALTAGGGLNLPPEAVRRGVTPGRRPRGLKEFVMTKIDGKDVYFRIYTLTVPEGKAQNTWMHYRLVALEHKGEAPASAESLKGARCLDDPANSKGKIWCGHIEYGYFPNKLQVSLVRSE